MASVSRLLFHKNSLNPPPPLFSEMAQAFARLGSKVHLLTRSSTLLPGEDADAVKVIQAALEKDGVKVFVNQVIESVDVTEKGKLVKSRSHIDQADRTDKAFTEILV